MLAAVRDFFTNPRNTLIAALIFTTATVVAIVFIHSERYSAYIIGALAGVTSALFLRYAQTRGNRT